MPTAPPAADLFSLKKSCKIEQEVVIFVGYSRHSVRKKKLYVHGFILFVVCLILLLAKKFSNFMHGFKSAILAIFQ